MITVVGTFRNAPAGTGGLTVHPAVRRRLTDATTPSFGWPLGAGR